MKLPLTIIFVSLLAVARGPAAVLYTETFEGGANGWTGAGGAMTVTHQGSVGSPASGAMQGMFDAQGLFPIPQTDSFMIDSGTDFLGSYNTLTGFTFDLFAESVLPSDLSVRIWSGANVFFYAVSLALMNPGAWTTFEVPLTYSAGWQDGGEVGFLNALDNVTRVDVQLTRNGTGEQYFYLDNFGTLNTGIGGGGGSAVPEPSTGLMMGLVGGLLFSFRKRVWRSRAGEGAQS